MPRTFTATKQAGFTLVEMLVIAPLLVLVIATFISLMISMVGDVLIANYRVQTQYDLQDALNQIEQDTYASSMFLTGLSAGTATPTSPAFQSPQGKNDSTGAFSSASGDLILNQYTTSDNPNDPSKTRSLIYYADAMPCTANVVYKPAFRAQVIYFTKVESGITNLYRRTIVPPNNQNTTIDANTTCAKPWQRNSCTSMSLNASICQTKDAKLLTDISAISITYFNKVAPTATIAASASNTADSLRVSITTTKTIAGSSVSQSAYLTASKFNSE